MTTVEEKRFGEGLTKIRNVQESEWTSRYVQIISFKHRTDRKIPLGTGFHADPFLGDKSEELWQQ